MPGVQGMELAAELFVIESLKRIRAAIVSRKGTTSYLQGREGKLTWYRQGPIHCKQSISSLMKK
jgi:hypothetical protein